MNYTTKQIYTLIQNYDESDIQISECWKNLIVEFEPKLENPKAKEFLLNGVCRRLQVLQRASTNLNTIFPPTQKTALHRDLLQDIDINLQSFLINAYGTLDNLAWVFVFENSLEEIFTQNQVGLHKPEVQAFMQDPLKTYLSESTLLRIQYGNVLVPGNSNTTRNHLNCLT